LIIVGFGKSWSFARLQGELTSEWEVSTSPVKPISPRFRQNPQSFPLAALGSLKGILALLHLLAGGIPPRHGLPFLAAMVRIFRKFSARETILIWPSLVGSGRTNVLSSYAPTAVISTILYQHSCGNSVISMVPNDGVKEGCVLLQGILYLSWTMRLP